MSKNALLFVLLCFVFINSSAQSFLGQWQTVDDNTGDVKSVVEIYEEEGKIYGKIIQLTNPDLVNAVCTKCEGDKKDTALVGLVIIEGLSKNEDVYDGGTILNPENGITYKCRLKLDKDKDTLQIRGYLAFFYRTQYWKRAK